MQNNSNRTWSSQASGRGRWYSYRTRKNQQRNEPATSPSASPFSGATSTYSASLTASSAPYARQFAHPPSASTLIYPSQYPQRVQNVASCQLHTQRQSQRGRSHSNNLNTNTTSSSNSNSNANSNSSNNNGNNSSNNNRTNRQISRRNRQNARRSKEIIHNSIADADAASGTSSAMEVEVEVEERPHSPVPPSLKNLAVRGGASVEESDIPGFAYDPSTQRYFRIQSEASGSAIGFRRRDFTRARRERERLAQFQVDQRRSSINASFGLLKTIKPLISSLRSRELGYKSSMVSTSMQYGLSESSLLSVSNTPSYTREVLPNHLDHLAGCQFLDVSKDGRTILGCWAVSNWGMPGDSRRTSSRIMCLNVECDPEIVRRNGLLEDGGSKYYDNAEVGNHYGLKFEATDNSIYVLEPNLVDMVTAPVDSDVTCVLYVTASSHLNMKHKLTTCCRVFIEPIPELSNEEDSDEMSSPIYNIRWSCQDEVWSCAWNANKMRIGLGMEENAMIVDVVSEQNFRISSKRRNVLSQQFSQDGDLLYMGLCGADMVCSDLRLKSHHIVNTFEQSNSVGWIRLLKSQPRLLLTENFAGELKLWDVRSRKTLMSFKGHKNSHYRLPCFVDDNEKFIFAVGEDGTARGWSLRSGELLCAVPSPRPIEQRTDFPRLVYSENWAARAGNSAIIIAVEGDLRVHELTL